jgi:hypothetical protein
VVARVIGATEHIELACVKWQRCGCRMTPGEPRFGGGFQHLGLRVRRDHEIDGDGDRNHTLLKRL